MFRAEQVESWSKSDTSSVHCRITVYHHDTQRMETLVSTDPYSRGLSTDGERSMFVNLSEDTSLMPEGWSNHRSPAIQSTPFMCAFPWLESLKYKSSSRDLNPS